MRSQIGDVSRIRSLDIYSFDAAVDIIGSEPEKWKPQERETADHSLPYITAAALMDGTITDGQFAPERFRDPKLLDLVAKVKVQRNAELSGMYPGAVGNRLAELLRFRRRLLRFAPHDKLPRFPQRSPDRRRMRRPPP